MMTKNGNKTFIRVTNTDIWNELKLMRELLESTIKANEGQHYCLKGSTKAAKSIGIAALALSSWTLGWLIAHLLQ
jgi:hypothetical protein